MTTLLTAGTVVVILGLVAAVAAYLWVTGTMVEHIASLLSEQIAPGAQAVRGHVADMAPAIRSLESAIDRLT